MKIIVTVFFIAIFGAVCAQTYSVETVPNPKEQSNSFVSNPDGILSDSAVNVINRLLQTLEDKNTTQVAVVALTSIGDAVLFDFCQKLFERWKIGDAAKDNGLLVVLVTDQRKIRFHSGFGIEDQLPDVTGKHIQKQLMLPYFKNGDYSGGMVAGIEEVVKILGNTTYAAERNADIKSDNQKAIAGLTGFFLIGSLIVFGIKSASGNFSGRSKIRHERRLPYVKNTKASWLLWFFVMPLFLGIVAVSLLNYWVFFIGLYSILSLSLIASWQRLSAECLSWEIKNEFKLVYDFLRKEKWVWILSAFVFPLPGVLYLRLFNHKIIYFRNHPRNCRQCGSSTVKLSELEEDAYLTKAQSFEEDLKSVDYDVWKCTSCNSTEIALYENDRSKFALCPKCKTKAYLLDKVLTTSEPTYSSTGSKEEHYQCKFCTHHAVVHTTIAMLVESSSSSSSDSGSSSSDSGSFGGGDSGGGGSESSW
jgi:uncharacterized protein